MSAVGRGPNRPRAAPASGEPITISTVSGSTRSPVVSGSRPSVSWRWKVAVNTLPNRPAETTSRSAMAAVTGTDRARAGGTKGCADRRSLTTNTAARPTAPASSRRVAGAPQPRTGTWESAWTSTARQPASSTAPVRPSRRATGRSRSGSRSAVAGSTTASTSGRLIQNTDCQPKCATRSPPSTGPLPAATAMAPVRTAIARRSSRSGYASRSTASVAGWSRAPHTPCATRSPMTQPTEGASAIPAEARPKPVRPRWSSRRCPYRSPSRPARTSRAATATR